MGGHIHADRPPSILKDSYYWQDLPSTRHVLEAESLCTLRNTTLLETGALLVCCFYLPHCEITEVTKSPSFLGKPTSLSSFTK